MSELTLISFASCPYVQRAAILLLEQRREYALTYIDLRDKPDWFLDLSPRGRVPVLKVGDTAIVESEVILEYLDETSDGGQLLPDAPLERARHRMWIRYISELMSTGWRLQSAGDEETVRALAETIRGALQTLSATLPAGGPFWGGATYSLVDVAAAPMLQRFTWAERLEPTLGLFEELPRVAAWRDALLARPSTDAAILPGLERQSARLLHGLGSWVARGAGEPG